MLSLKIFFVCLIFLMMNLMLNHLELMKMMIFLEVLNMVILFCLFMMFMDYKKSVVVYYLVVSTMEVVFMLVMLSRLWGSNSLYL